MGVIIFIILVFVLGYYYVMVIGYCGSYFDFILILIVYCDFEVLNVFMLDGDNVNDIWFIMVNFDIF